MANDKLLLAPIMIETTPRKKRPLHEDPSDAYPSPRLTSPISAARMSSPTTRTPNRLKFNDLKIPVAKVVSEITIGRSSKLSDVVLQHANRLISRIHVKAELVNGALQIECIGWNGCIVTVADCSTSLSRGEKLDTGVSSNVLLQVLGTYLRLEGCFGDEATFKMELETDRLQVGLFVLNSFPNRFHDQPVNPIAQISHSEMNNAENMAPTEQSDNFEVNNSTLLRQSSTLDEQETHIKSIIGYLKFTNMSTTNFSTLSRLFPSINSPQVLKKLHETESIGVVERNGKDAAGKPLENEYFFKGRGLRACRQVHKQYFWKKPNK